MKKVEKENFRKRIKILMSYSLKETLKENSKRILEQGTDIPLIDPVDLKKRYPNYCKYPNMTVVPSKNEVGVSGLDAIPEGYCCYIAPKQKSLNGGEMVIFLPSDTEITFWNESNIKLALEEHFRKHKVKETQKKILETNFRKIFSIGFVREFKIKGDEGSITYSSWIQRKPGQSWYFLWFYNENKKPYPKVKWTDPRNSWDKFVDEWVDFTQWTIAIAAFIVGFFTEGATWLLYLELGTEGVLGIISAQRDLEKGDNISAGFNLIFAGLPWLKQAGWFTGINPEELQKLTRSIRNAGLDQNSTPDQIKTWYLSLDNKDKEIFSKMVKAGDEISEVKLKKIFQENMNNLLTQIKEDPNLLKSVEWYKQVPVKEFTIQAASGFISLITSIFYGEKLNNEELKKMTSIYNNAKEISEQLAVEVLENYTRNANNIKQILEHPLSNELQNKLLIPKTEDVAKWFNTNLKDSIVQSGGEYLEIVSDKSKALPEESVSDEEIKKYLEMGYKKYNELTPEEKEIAKRPKKMNGFWYWYIEPKIEK